jgi:ketosteroid isomerase-like protein
VAISNRATVETYLNGFRRTDRALILSCLTDDVEWEIPGYFSVRGKDDFARHIVDEGFVGSPEISVSRWIEAPDLVVIEGTVRAPRTDGGFLELAICDVFDMRDGRIRRLVSYLMEMKPPTTGEPQASR